MNPILSFTIIMLIWTIGDYIAKKTKSLISSMLVASIIFIVGFKTNIFPEDLLTSSSLLALGNTVVAFVIIHIGTMISIDEFKKQWKTFVIGIAAVCGIAISLFLIGSFFKDVNYVIASIAGISGSTISVIIVQEEALALGLVSVAVLPALISAFQGVIGFPLTSIILRKEAKRLQEEYKAGNLQTEYEISEETEDKTILPEALQTTAGTLFSVGVVALIAYYINQFSGGVLNTFVVALILGVLLRTTGVFKKNILNGIDAYGLMMLAILIIIFAPLATISVDQLIELILPLSVAFVVGVLGNMLFSAIVGKLLGYSMAMSVAIGLTSLYGFPGTMVLSQEAAKSVGENQEEIQAIENQILPKMIIAGFSTVTITSVVLTGILVSYFYY